MFGGGLGLVPVPWASWPSFNHTYWIQGNTFTSEDAGGNAGPTEVAFMILDAWEYTSDPRYLERYLRIPVETMAFFMQHYPNRTAAGRVVVWPTQALESFQCVGWNTTAQRPPADCCVDDMPTVAGITALLLRLMALPTLWTTAEQRASWAMFKPMLPELPVDDTQLLVARVVSTLPKGDESHAAPQNPPTTKGGKPAWVGFKDNSEVPELYAVHPYRYAVVGVCCAWP